MPRCSLPAIQPGIEETITLEPDDVDDHVLWGRYWMSYNGSVTGFGINGASVSSLSLTIRYSDRTEVTRHQKLTPETCWEIDLSPFCMPYSTSASVVASDFS